MTHWMKNQKTPRSIVRNKAKDRGEKFYIWRCSKHGEHALYYVSNNRCVDCDAERRAERQKTLPKARKLKKTQAEQEKVRYINGWPV